jgi:hypothetical protein
MLLLSLPYCNSTKRVLLLKVVTKTINVPPILKRQGVVFPSAEVLAKTSERSLKELPRLAQIFYMLLNATVHPKQSLMVSKLLLLTALAGLLRDA